MAKVQRTRNNGTWTEAAYWGRVRSALRKAFAAWQPSTEALKAARRPSESENKRLKWEYLCASCCEWFARKDVRLDHIVPCGSLKCSDDLSGWLERLTPEDPAAYQVLCETCHQAKTNSERQERE